MKWQKLANLVSFRYNKPAKWTKSVNYKFYDKY